MILRPILPLLVACMAVSCTQQSMITLSGKVVDPATHQGIPNVYVAVQGDFATGFMGGTEYRDDLARVSTTQDGSFRLLLPVSAIDSFILKHPAPINVHRFSLEVRCDSSEAEWPADQGCTILSRLLPVDTGFNFDDRNNLNKRLLVLTGKNDRIRGDKTDMTIGLCRAGYLRLAMSGDWGDWSKYLVYLTVRQRTKQDYAYLDEAASKKKVMIGADIPTDIVVTRWQRDNNRNDTLAVLSQVVLPPGATKDIPLSFH